MALLSKSYNYDELPVSSSSLPEGEYPVVITNAEEKSTKDLTGSYLELTYTVTGARFSGMTVRDRINLRNNNEKAVQIGIDTLRKIMGALSLRMLNDTNQLLNRRMIIKVSVRKYTDQNGMERETNDVRGYKADPSSPIPQAPPQEQPKASPLRNAPPVVPGFEDDWD